MLIQISSGKGPLECELAVGKFLAELKKEFDDLKVVQENHGKYAGCYKSVVFSTNYSTSNVVGTVKWMTQSPFRPKHKRKNWFIDISVFEEEQEITFSEGLIRFDTFRCGGHGGQNVNKVETGVRAVHIPTGTSVVCTEARTQHLNKKLALNRLCEIIGQQNTDAHTLAKQTMWMQHELIERGNPIRVYEGVAFRRIK